MIINGIEMILVHDDGHCLDGQMYTPLDLQGYCPVCGFIPDMQSTGFVRKQSSPVSDLTNDKHTTL